MARISVDIRLDISTPGPNIPDGYASPDSIQIRNFDGTPWTWNGTNISLIRSPASKTVADQLLLITVGFKNKLLRPLQATELVQMTQIEEDWPHHWRNNQGGGRIFFAGSVYSLVYGTTTKCELIWYAYFDTEESEWQYHCASTESVLRKGDEFACIAHDPRKPLLERTPRPLAPMRRERRVSVSRQTIAMTR